MLAQRRLTAAQLHAKLTRRGFDDEAAAEAVASCKRDRLLDDALYATLFVESKRAALGDARLVAELVKRGIDRDEARRSVDAAATDQPARAAAAYDKLRRADPKLSYGSAARKLERLGFPASLVYRVLRERAGEDYEEFFADLA